jgi:hypothetical protein
VCARGSDWAPACGPSTSPLDAMKAISAAAVFIAVTSPALGSSPDAMAQKVTALVNDTVAATTEASAFAELERLGDAAVPYIIGHLSDFRSLPIRSISLDNKSPTAFEGLRHYAPETVHDALSAILNQLTGKSFESVYNGASSEVRVRNVKAWEAWCTKALPVKASVCKHGI